MPECPERLCGRLAGVTGKGQPPSRRWLVVSFVLPLSEFPPPQRKQTPSPPHCLEPRLEPHRLGRLEGTLSRGGWGRLTAFCTSRPVLSPHSQVAALCFVLVLGSLVPCLPEFSSSPHIVEEHPAADSSYADSQSESHLRGQPLSRAPSSRCPVWVQRCQMGPWGREVWGQREGWGVDA